MRETSKDLRNLQLALWEANDKPILYMSKIHGDKYIVPKKIYEEQLKELQELKSGHKKVELKICDDKKANLNEEEKCLFSESLKNALEQIVENAKNVCFWFKSDEFKELIKEIERESLSNPNERSE